MSEHKHTPTTWDSAYPGSISPREDGQYIDRDDSKSLAYALLRKIEDQDKTIEDFQSLNVDANDMLMRIPHTEDGVPIFLGDTVWFENPDRSHGESMFMKGVVDCIYFPITFPEYKGDVGIQTNMEGLSWDGGNLDCWSSEKTAKESFARELEQEHLSQLEDDRREESAQRMEGVR